MEWPSVMACLFLQFSSGIYFWQEYHKSDAVSFLERHIMGHTMSAGVFHFKVTIFPSVVNK